jgi:hypothetical protein
MFLAAATSTSPDAGSVILAIILVIASIAAYWVPTIVSATRKVPNMGSVVVVNLFLGWTIVGWIVALAMAFRDPRPQMNGAH